MTQLQKNLLNKAMVFDSIQEFLGSFVFVYLSLYTMKHVHVSDVSVSNLAECVIGFVVLHLCGQIKNINRIINHLVFIEIFLLIFSTTVALCIVHSPATALILLAINRVLIQHLLGSGFGAMYNRIYQGDDRTIMINKIRQWRTLSYGLAGLLVIMIGDLDIQIVIKMYIIINVILTIMDLIQIRWINHTLKEVTT